MHVDPAQFMPTVSARRDNVPQVRDVKVALEGKGLSLSEVYISVTKYWVATFNLLVKFVTS